METNNILINSIENVRSLIGNSILMLQDLDKALSKYKFEPIFGNAIGTETSKSIHQTSEQSATFFPQYMARPYAHKDEIELQNVKKIIFINIQFYHYNYVQLVPSLISGVIVLPKPVTNIKNKVQNWWLKDMTYESSNWEDINKNGQINKISDEYNYKSIFWCNELTSFHGQQSIISEAEKLVEFFNNTVIDVESTF